MWTHGWTQLRLRWPAGGMATCDDGHGQGRHGMATGCSGQAARECEEQKLTTSKLTGSVGVGEGSEMARAGKRRHWPVATAASWDSDVVPRGVDRQLGDVAARTETATKRLQVLDAYLLGTLLWNGFLG